MALFVSICHNCIVMFFYPKLTFVVDVDVFFMLMHFLVFLAAAAVM